MSIFFAEEEYFFEVAEAVFVGWFTFEYVIRFIAAPRKIEWVLNYQAVDFFTDSKIYSRW